MMRAIKLHSIILYLAILFLPAQGLLAQGSDSIVQTLYFKSDILIDDSDFDENGEIQIKFIDDTIAATGTYIFKLATEKNAPYVDLISNEDAVWSPNDSNRIDHYSNGLNFTYENTVQNCSTSKCSFVIDSVNSTKDSIIIESLTFEYYDLYYLTDRVCSSAEMVQLKSEVLPEDLSFESLQSTLVFDDSLNIIPSESDTGLHIINFSSNYCLTRLSDTINIIPALETNLAFDTLTYCSISLNDQNQLNNYTILSINNWERIYDYTTGQNVLISDLEDNGCLQYDTCFIKPVEPLRTNLDFDTLALCSNDMNEIERNDKYTFLSLDNKESLYSFLGEQNVLISDLEDNGCLLYDTCYIKIVKPVDMSLDIDNKCDSVIVSLSNGNYTVNNLSWSNGLTERTIKIDSTQTIAVQLTDNYNCISIDTFTIEVKPFEIQTMDISTYDADCWTEGELNINEIATTYGSNNLSYTLRNKLNKATLTDLTTIPEGMYEVEVENEDGCIKIPKKEIEVRQKCLEDYPVFTPNMDGVEDEYYIPYEGIVKIYDKNGNLKRILDTPAYWDGTNESGVKLPMGVYLLVTDAGKNVNITIVR